MSLIARNIIATTANEITAPRSVTEEQISSITSVVGVDMEMHGKYVGKKASGGICIEGQYQGSITFEKGGVVRIAQGAIVNETTLEADVVLIEGTFTGTVRARRLLEVLPCASIEGAIHYADLDMHRGAKVKAELHTLEPLDELDATSEVSTTASASAPAPATAAKAFISPFSAAGERVLPTIRPAPIHAAEQDQAATANEATPLGVVGKV